MRRAVVLAALIATTTASAGSVPTGIEVASGFAGHTSWTLLADDTKSGSFSVTMLINKRLDSSEGGTLDLKGPRAITYLAHSGRPAPNYIVGPVIATATHVVITYANGRRITVPTIRAPAGLASNLRFYVHFTGCQTLRPARIAGLDSRGRVVAAMMLATRFGPRETC